MAWGRTSALAMTTAVIALAGCSGSDDDNGLADMSAEEIFGEAQAAVADTDSAAMDGALTEDDGTEITAEFQFSDSDAAGTMGIDGAEFEVLSIAGTMYIKGSADAWNQIASEGLGERAADKYVQIPLEELADSGDPELATTVNNQFALMVRFKVAIDEMLSSEIVEENGLTVGDESEIDGQKVIGVGDDEATLYFATTGDPLPVRLEGPESQGSFDFEWNVDADFTEPPEDEIIDLSSVLQDE